LRSSQHTMSDGCSQEGKTWPQITVSYYKNVS
jgi:hypothetical protein